MKATPSTPTVTKPTTIHDVAEAVGLHKSTVSLAFSGKGNLSAATRERVLTAARQMDYEPNPLARRLAHGHRNTTVCLFSSTLDVGLTTEKILLIQQELNRRSLEVPIYTCGQMGLQGAESQAAQIKQLCRQRPRAIVCAAHDLNPDVFQELEAYQGQGGIVVSYDLPVPLHCDQVIFDREDNAYRTARHLLERGHRRIGLGMSNPTGLYWARDAINGLQSFRMRGFLRALEEFGVPWRDEWFFQNPVYEKGGAAMARQFLNLKERPTALCIVNDYVAFAFMVEVMRAGVRVPDDVSIVGHDNQPIAVYCPVPLTCASQPVREITEAVVEMLIERVAGSTASPRTVTIRGEIVARQSVTASPA